MSSLRRRLVVGTAIGSSTILLVAGTSLYALMSRTLYSEVDRSLIAQATIMASMVELTAEGIEPEFAEAPSPEIDRLEYPEYYQLWMADSEVIARSPSLEGQDLAQLSELAPRVPRTDRNTFAHGLWRKTVIKLPNGNPARVFATRFTAVVDDELPSGVHAPTVVLALARDIGEIRSTLATLGGTLLLTGALSLLATIILLRWLVRVGLKPADALAAKIQRIDERQLSVRIDPIDTPLELQPMVVRINEMLERLEEAFDRERTMTANIAHELRTPLAGLRTTLEVALSRERESTEYREAMHECRTICEQLQTLIVNLLSLARLDSGREVLRRGTIDVDRLMRDTWSVVQARTTHEEFSVSWNMETSMLADTDGDKLGLVLANVFDNAVQYVNRGGQVSVDARRRNGEVQISVANTGSRITSDQIKHVFDRFWRGDEARHSNGVHSGLGLALCKTIVERLGGKISAESESGQLFRVNIILDANEPPGAV